MGLLILAHALDRGAHAVAGLLAVQPALRLRVLRPEWLGSARWSLSLDAHGHARSRLQLADGARLDGEAITMVWNRVRELPLAGFRNSPAADRDYALAELQAAASSWLASLGQRVEPPMRRHATVTAAPHLLHWAAAAAGCGLALPAGLLDTPAPLPRRRVLVTPGECVAGDSAAWPAEHIGRCQALARALGFAIVELGFCGPADAPQLCHVDTFPALQAAGQAAACARWLARRCAPGEAA